MKTLFRMLAAAVFLFTSHPVIAASGDSSVPADNMPYTSTEDRENFLAEARAADAVFTAKLDSAFLSRVTLKGVTRPMTKVTFQSPEFLKSSVAPETPYSYRQSPESLQIYKEIPAIVAVKRPLDNPDNFFVTRMIPADRANLEAVKTTLATPRADSCATASESCGESTLGETL